MQKDSRTPSFAHLITHFGMGTILGALFALALVISNRQLSHLIASASSPSTSMALFVGFFSFVFAIGACLSGYIFTAVELNALEAKQQTEPVKRRRDLGT
jgi:predicted MFS family arabinose efflux permease